MRPAERLVLASSVSVMLAALTMLPITQDRGYLGWSLVLVLLLGGLASLARRSPLRERGVLLTHPLVLIGFGLLLARSERGPGQAELPTLDTLSWLTTSAVEHLRTQAAPMQPHPGVQWLMVMAVGIAMVLTDILVCGLQRQVWGIAPSLALFLIPALSLRADVGVLGGAAVALGYFGILLAEGINRAERWRRGVVDDPHHRPRPVAPVLWGSAAVITIPALVLSLIAWLVVPTGSLAMFNGGPGSGDGPLQLSDPTLDLRRNLTQPEDRVILTYQTSGGDEDRSDQGLYLRMASLPRFDGNGWQNTAIDVVTGQPGTIPGVRGNAGPRRSTTIDIGQFDSEYLPLPYAPRRLEVPGKWGYDPLSLVYIATAGEYRHQATRDLSYRVESVDLEPDGAELSSAGVGRPSDYVETGSPPDDLPPEITELALDITKDIDGPALKAAAIQAYLRSGAYEYSTVPAPGTGYEALTNFLFHDKRGYCEQFAAAMAVLARAAGIPTRVAIGFLPGEKVGDHWEVTTHDLHSWPELYFDGLGWVRWEPTPGNGTTPPPWTIAQDNQDDEPSASSSASDEPSESSSEPTAEDSAPTGEESTDVAGTDQAEATGSMRGWWVVLGVVVALAVLAAVPALLRERRRRSRRAAGEPTAVRVEGAWQEVRDTVLDHRGDWPSGSPRVIGRQLGRGLSGAEAADVAELAVLVERVRYSRGLDEQTDREGIDRLAERVNEAVIGPVSRGQRIRALLWPRSLWHGGTLREAMRRPGRSGRRGL